MQRNQKLNDLLESFSELYWLKPVDIVWDAVNAYYIQNMIKDDDIILDLGCGDGLFTALMFGGRLPKEYDRFLYAKPQHQKIEENQEGDIYSKPIKLRHSWKKKPHRKVNFGLELKRHHIDIAESLGIYTEIIEGRFENIPLNNETIKKIFSAFAFYWGDNLELQVKEVRRVLKKGGEFIVTLPSEYLYDLHIAKKLSEEDGYSETFKNFMEDLDGGRRKLACRYSKSINEWEFFFEQRGFEFIEAIPVVNEIMFTLQDISQRPFLPILIEASNLPEFEPYRDRVKEFLCSKVHPRLIDNLLKYENEQNVRHGYYLVRVKK